MRRPPLQLPLSVRYALAAGVVLSTLGPGERASAAELAELTGVPGPFLSKILVELAGAGLVRGSRGRGGGYELIRPAGEVTVGDIVDALAEEPDVSSMPDCLLGGNPCAEDDDCELRGLWRTASAGMNQLLETTTLADLARLKRGC